MPTYEYVCQACGHEFERFQQMREFPARRCPECGRQKARRKISAGGGVLFKGSGFYATDYRKPSPEAAKKSKAESKAELKGKSGESSSKSGGESDDG